MTKEQQELPTQDPGPYLDFASPIATTPDGRPVAVLRVETLSDAEGRAAHRIVLLAEAVALLSLVAEVSLKYTKDDHLVLRVPYVEIWNTVAASLYSAILVALWTFWLYKLRRALKAKLVWLPRRKFLVTMYSVELILRSINVVCYLVPNVYSLVHPCDWGGAVIAWTAAARWICWYSSFAVMLVGTHSANLWTDGRFSKVPAHLRAGASVPMVIDKPLWTHWPKGLLLAASIAVVICHRLYGSTNVLRANPCGNSMFCLEGGIPRPADAAHCRSLQYACTVLPGVTAFRAGYILLFMVFLLLCVHYQRTARSGLKHLHFSIFRVASTTIRLQTRLRLWAILCMIITTLLLWYLGMGTCTTNLQVWLGLFPMQTIMMALSCVNIMLYWPQDVVTDARLQAYQQAYAWTEADPAFEAAAKENIDMFCFETTLKAFYWSRLVYHLSRTDKTESKYSINLALEIAGLKEHLLIAEQSSDTQAIIGWSSAADGPRRIVLAFRGTASRQNVMSDVQAWRTPFPYQHQVAPSYWTGRPMVHKGFLEAWLTVREQVLQQVTSLMKSTAPEHPCQILVTGHSLGGALAQLAAYDIKMNCADSGADVKVSCYILGAPRVGNAAFARAFEAAGAHSWSIINRGDPVTQHGKFMFLYKRPGQRVLVGTGDMLVAPPFLEAAVWRRAIHVSIAQHMMGAYRKSFAAIIHRHLTLEKASHQGKQALLDLAQQPGMQQVLEIVAEGRAEDKRAKHTPVPQPSGAQLMLDLSPSLEDSASQELDGEIQGFHVKPGLKDSSASSSATTRQLTGSPWDSSYPE